MLCSKFSVMYPCRDFQSWHCWKGGPFLYGGGSLQWAQPQSITDIWAVSARPVQETFYQVQSPPRAFVFETKFKKQKSKSLSYLWVSGPRKRKGNS